MPKKSAFFYFMMECQRREALKGRVFRNLAEVAEAADEIWQQMDVAERAPYVQRANPSHHALPKPQGQPALAKVAEKDLLGKRIQAAGKELGSETFILISIGYYCRTLDNVYFPAEIGAVKFGLAAGVAKRFHAIVDHPKLPTGMAYEAKLQSEMTHALPLPPHGLAEMDGSEIASKLISFFDAKDDRLPVLFTAAKQMSAVEAILLDMLGDRIREQKLRICSVAELYWELQQAAVSFDEGTTEPFKMLQMAQNRLDDDVFSYTEGISCDYHESHELLVHCELSECIRWAFTIARDCCPELGIELIPGKHRPGTKEGEAPFGEELKDDDTGESKQDELEQAVEAKVSNEPISNGKALNKQQILTRELLSEFDALAEKMRALRLND
ncbi:protein maelstrom homolog [Anopheles stephensi]|uniref:protein maelstrom homolog n=1 Tax=Anopheles stephensi TaxID=30069 RepID=UPI0016588460|nr:protein maelstrom homolog [Anopheles stephensi]